MGVGENLEPFAADHNTRRAKGVKRPSSRFKAFGASRWSPSPIAQDPNRDREAPVHSQDHTSPRTPLKPENAGFRPQSAFRGEMLQKGHEPAGRDRQARRAIAATGLNTLLIRGSRRRPGAAAAGKARAPPRPRGRSGRPVPGVAKLRRRSADSRRRRVLRVMRGLEPRIQDSARQASRNRLRPERPDQVPSAPSQRAAAVMPVPGLDSGTGMTA